MTEVRVLHVPARTPYARKLRDDRVRILNGTRVDGLLVPRDATLAWLLAHRPWGWLDVMHLHHVDFEPVTRLRTVLAECRRAGIPVVFTAHDVDPVFGDRAAHTALLGTLAAGDVPFVCLTPGSERQVRHRFDVRTVVVPHGRVAAPGTRRRPVAPRGGATRFLVYGSLRRNRDIELVLACWRFARGLADTTLHLLLRAPSRASLREDAAAWQAIREHAVDPRLQVDVLPFPSDDDVDAAVAAADCLVLPYRWASHSGQLEHAFDLGVLPVAARTGYLPEQVTVHGDLVPQPMWFDWSDDAVFDHGARLLEVLQAAHTTIGEGWRPCDGEAFTEHRRHEHNEVMDAYYALYAGL